MNLAQLALISLAALAGPALALSGRWGVPVVVGELLVGVVLGPTWLSLLQPTDPILAFLADAGFALVMFVAGSHVPVTDPRLRQSLPIGVLRAGVVGLASIPVAWAIATLFGTHHAALYAILLASSSAAVILPIIDGLSLHNAATVQLLPQVAIADVVCILALPLVIDPARAGTSAVGALAVLAAAAATYGVLHEAERRGWRKPLHDVSQRRKFALELRINLAILFGLAALAQTTRVSLMLAGFSFGLVIAALGEPRRLARQLFAVTEGFFSPIFFVWLGASLDLAALARQPSLIGLGVALGLGAALTHLTPRLTHQPIPYGGLASAQLGVPVAAAALGTQAHLLNTGEPAAILLGAVTTIGVASWAANHAAVANGLSRRDAHGNPDRLP